MNIIQKIIADGRDRQRDELIRFLRSYAVHAADLEDRAGARRALDRLNKEGALKNLSNAFSGISIALMSIDWQGVVDSMRRLELAMDRPRYNAEQRADRLYDRIMAFWDRWLPDPDKPKRMVVGVMDVHTVWSTRWRDEDISGLGTSMAQREIHDRFPRVVMSILDDPYADLYQQRPLYDDDGGDE